MWFRAYAAIAPEARHQLIELLERGSFLYYLANHYSRRLHGVQNPKMTAKRYKEELDEGQQELHRHIVEKWALISDGQYAPATVWLTHAIRVSLS